ncbi:MAG TPA: Mov34/MPN/PAD-1 family protein [Acidiferrobacter sp.]|nr:Mov34/MPN/PAD-1 family protein [Acidiferrobacter sp.]
MNDDKSQQRPQPTTPYVATGRVTKIDPRVLTMTRRTLRAAGQKEAGCLWLGAVAANGEASVEAIVVPKQTNRARNFSIAAGAMREIATLARPQKWVLVAAVHSHPGISVEHSEYDDKMVPSRHALSLVFAHYGAERGAWPNGVGVHEFVDDYWHLLSPEDAAKRVTLAHIPRLQLLDLR